MFILEIIIEINLEKCFSLCQNYVFNRALIGLQDPFVFNFSRLQLNKLVIAVLCLDQLSTPNQPRATSLKQVITSLPPILMGVKSPHLHEN